MEKRTIDYCRQYYCLPDDVTDAQIAEECRGSLLEAFCNISTAKDEFKSAVKEALPIWLQRILESKKPND